MYTSLKGPSVPSTPKARKSLRLCGRLLLSPEEWRSCWRPQNGRFLCDQNRNRTATVSAMKMGKMIPTAEFPCNTSSAVKIRPANGDVRSGPETRGSLNPLRIVKDGSREVLLTITCCGV